MNFIFGYIKKVVNVMDSMITKYDTHTKGSNSIGIKIAFFFITNMLCALTMLIVHKSISVFVFMILMALITIFILPRDKEFITLMTIVVVIYTISIMLLYSAQISTYGVPYIGGGSDDLKFERMGELFYTNSWYDFTENYGTIIGYGTPSDWRLYATLIACLYKFGSFFDSYSTFLPRFCNLYLVISILHAIYKLAIEYFKLDRKTAQKAIFLIALFPNFIYINIHIFRDSLNIMLLLWAMYYFYVFISKGNHIKRIYSCILVAILTFLLFFTRPESIYILICTMAIMVLYNGKVKAKMNTIILLGILFLIFEYFTDTLGLFNYVSYYANYRGSKSGLSSYLMSYNLFPFGIIFRFLYGLIIPFPAFWTLFQDKTAIGTDIIDGIVMLGTLWQIVNLPIIFASVKKVSMEFVFFIIQFSVFIMITFTFRHVIFFYPFMMLAYANNESKVTRKFIICSRLFMCVVGVFMCIIYFAIKF